ncbi:MAG: protein kinase, partial [Byssovorax sp.]
QVGELVADRFEIEARASTGGMGEVFRARDRTTGEPVAVKVLLHNHAIERMRFAQEIEVLARIRHPGIVNYVAHGRMPTGLPYFVMEWLDGEDLGSLLARRKLSIHESVELLTRVAGILAVMHAQGIVHRDLKPTNLFLVGGDVGLVKVLDLGIARMAGQTLHLTATGMLVGTPGYMAPEQARGGTVLDARADVFSLGCVLFECLTGAPAFSGEHIAAILGKILFEESSKIADLRPDTPQALDALIRRMLAKDPKQRPRDGAEVAAAAASLGAHGPIDATVEELEHPPRSVLTGRERRLFAVVIIGTLHPRDLASAVTLGEHEITLTEAEFRAAAAFGGHLEALADGSALVTITGTRVATDLAAQAARCALSLRAAVGGRPMALAIGRAEVTGRTPVGEAIDRAATILAGVAVRASAAPCGGETAAPPIGLDEITARLLEPSFDVVARDAGFELRGERETFEGTRTLLGKPTPCVGRERELLTLEALFNQCVDEPTAQAVLVTAPAGLGKSRLAHETLQAIRRRRREVEIWIGRADALRVGSAFGLIGQVIRGACRVRDGEPPEALHRKLHARVALHVAAAEQTRVVELLAELAGAPLPDDERPALRELRQDAPRMGDEMRRAWEDFLLAECSHHPVVLVLEDLHWGDLPTMRLLDATLINLRNHPLLVLALARPEVHELFPRLWADRQMQEVRLHELTRKASEHLVR